MTKNLLQNILAKEKTINWPKKKQHLNLQNNKINISQLAAKNVSVITVTTKTNKRDWPTDFEIRIKYALLYWAS